MREELCRVVRQVDFSAPSIVDASLISHSFTQHSPGPGIVAKTRSNSLFKLKIGILAKDSVHLVAYALYGQINIIAMEQVN
jgi:hypothetical protein